MKQFLETFTIIITHVLKHPGQRQLDIARATGQHKSTVSRYLAQAVVEGWVTETNNRYYYGRIFTDLISGKH